MYKAALLIAVLLSTMAASPPPPAAVPYPNDVKIAFFKSCVGLHKEMIPACQCMTLGLERNMPYSDYLKLIEMEDPTQNKMFVSVANACLKKTKKP